MGESKKYYWFKFNKNFFQDHAVRILEGCPNGKEYVLLLLKLMAESISHEGRLRFSDTIPYEPEMLAALTNTNIDIVRGGMSEMLNLGLIELWDDRTIYINQLSLMIGSETDYARKKRAYREKKKQEQLEQKDNVLDKSANSPQTKKDNVLEMSESEKDKKRTMSDKSIEYRVKIKDIKDIKDNIYSRVESKKNDISINEMPRDKFDNIVVNIITYLNKLCNTNYRPKTKKTRSLINARLNEGFTLQDFLTVIDKKTAQWIGTEHEQYLRPETLFGTKFESYLNQKITNKKQSTSDLLRKLGNE